MSVRSIANAADLSSGTVQRLLAGDQEPRLGTFLALRLVFRLGSIEELLGESPSSQYSVHNQKIL